LQLAKDLCSLGLLFSILFRPHISENYNVLSVVANSINSFVEVSAFCFLVWSFKDYSFNLKLKHITVTTFVYAILWELMGYLNIYSTYHLKDSFVAILGGFVTFVLLSIDKLRKA